MMFRRVSYFFAALAVVLAQQASPPAGDAPATIFRSDTNLVLLNVSVFDQQGNVVKGIPKSAFSVFENAVKQDLSVFRQEDVPISLGLIIDNSASMQDKRQKVNSAALAMVKASNPDDEVFVINFSDEATITQEFTSDIRQLESSLRKIDSRGETAMRDALVLGLDHLSQRSKKDKKVLLVVTDGEDNSSMETQARLTEAAQRRDVIIYAVGLLGSEQPASAERARKALDELTLATGGRSWFPSDVSEIERIAPEIAHEIRNQYVLGYTPTNTAQDGSYRKIRVDVARPDVNVRTRTGYYARRAGA